MEIVVLFGSVIGFACFLFVLGWMIMVCGRLGKLVHTQNRLVELAEYRNHALTCQNENLVRLVDNSAKNI